MRMFAWVFVSVSMAAVVPAAHAQTLRLVGTLGNSGESGPSLVRFAGPTAAGMGPVIDDARAIWERAGAAQLNRYALDGRLLASFALPGKADRNDQMTRAGKLLVMKIGSALYTLPLDAEAGAKIKHLPGQADVLSARAFGNKVALLVKDDIVWLDPATGERTQIVTPDARPQFLDVDSDGTVYAFGGGKVQAWNKGTPVDGFPKGFSGERPVKIGRFWYSHSWHGTINRMNERFEPAPGVVLGGASGSFIGYLPQSVDLTNGRGMVHVRDNLFAVSGTTGIVQLLTWNDAELRFEIARRIGALPELTGVALDAAGNIWTPSGSWRWSDTPETPLTVGDREPDIHAQPVVLNGRTLCLLKKHYKYVQLCHGDIIDAHGWSHLENKGVKDFDLPDSITGAAAVPDGKGLKLIVAQRDGSAFEMGITEQGQQRGKPRPINIPGLKDCTSLAWFDGHLLAAAGGKVIAYAPDGDSGWKLFAQIADIQGQAFLHADGKRLAVSDTEQGKVLLFNDLKSPVASFKGLAAPKHIAVAGDRVVVYEAGKQRLLKLTLEPAKELAAVEPRIAAATKGKLPVHAEADFHDLSRPGGIPFAVALTPDKSGLTLSLKTWTKPEPRVQLGVADGNQPYLLSNEQARRENGLLRFHLPAGDWSRVKLTAAITFPGQRERFGFRDNRAIHAPFSSDPADWAWFDLENYRELVNARKQEIRITFEQPVDGKATVVIENEAGQRVRNLVSGRLFSAGQQTVVWDGLDENGKLVSPGNYRWRGITHPGIEPIYKMNFGNGGEKTVAPWGPNHSSMHHAASNGKLVFLAAPVTEGGWALVAIDTNGKLVQGYDHLHGYGILHDAIAADDKYLYCAQDGFAWGGTRGVDLGSKDWKATWKLTVVRYDIDSGKLVEFPGRKRAIEVDTMEVGPGSRHPNVKDFNLGGIAVRDGKLYIGSRDEKAVLVLDAATGKQLKSIPVVGVRHLAADPGASKEIYSATDRGVVRLSDGRLVVPAGKMNLAGITVAPSGDVLVSDGVSHQIHRYTSAGKHIGVIGTPGGPYQGVYDASRLVNPTGLVFGPAGKLWVTEDRTNPRRVSAWDLAKNQVVYEKFGMPRYGGDGSGFDPVNPRRWIGLGCFWDVDIDKGTARPTHILSRDDGHFGTYHPHSYVFFREKGRTFVCGRGKIALISEVKADGTLHDIAAVAGTHHFAYGCGWNPPPAYIEAFYKKWPEKRADERPGKRGEGKPWSQRGMGVLWVDRNGDGKTQTDEFDFCEGVEFAGGAWGHLQTSLTLYMPVADKEQVKVAAIQPRGFLASGVPDYPTLDQAIEKATPVSLTPGYQRSGVATVRDHFGRFIFNSDPEMNAYAADGRHLWSFPNQWSNVHGSHKAPLPEPGVMQGTLAILGLATFDKQSDVFFLNGNHGRCFMLTSDGLYLDEAFVDVRVSYLRNEYRLGGEIFGGSFGRSHVDGKYYVQIGHGPYRIYELAGLGSTKRMAGTMDVTREQIAAAERQSLRRVAEKQVARKASVPATLRWDKSGKFRVEVDVDADANHLYLEYRVQDASPWINHGRDWTKLFATGDTVDLQIATNPAADAKRRGPVPGDKRLLIAPFEGKPIAVLYEHRQPAGKNPIVFTSPWRGEKVDNVQRLPGVKIQVKKSQGGYTVKAAVPLADLGLAWKAGQAVRADFGVTYGDAEGTDTNLRSYWSNQSTGLVDDIPGEIMLSPNLWGEIRFTRTASK